MSSYKKTSPKTVVKTEEPDDDSFHPDQSSSTVVKREPESDDDFDEFPAGATPFTREQLLSRMDARKHGLQIDMDESSRDSFDDIVATPREQQAGPSTTRTPPHHQELLENTVIPEIKRFIADQEAVSLTSSITTTGAKTELKFTLVKTPTKRPAAEPDQGSGSSQLQAGSSNNFRRSRGVSPPEELETSREEPDDQNQTPKKKAAQVPDVNATPSPAKRLRTLNLNVSESEEEEEELEEEDEEEESSQETDETDPDYMPDTQEQRDRPADFRIPKNAPADPLDLDY
ncbi:hypothetical protein GCK72_022597 [Caenorhabditis remanei]|uniref:Uncharacterized protein n=1 Tax=Caenorhabditis remanei TaxID=31234 RepID=A0A6A5FUD1_CAERE|nr:hypothetical protein GCK72_022597 [Caenorhabditis remanei]KAF1746144.1 hypothetical protein GCK72_022597 [Caenorhabditis remanei]